jgi:hypothetical protein
MMNTAYKHLEAKLRIGEFSIGQWLALFVGVMTALIWGMYLSPFGTQITIFTACYIGGLPAAAIFLATMSEIDIVLLVRSAIRWRREEGRYLAGAGDQAHGYALASETVDERRLHTGQELAELDLDALWES